MPISYSGSMSTVGEALIKRFASDESIRVIIICNNSGVAITFTLKFVPKDTPNGNRHRVFYVNPLAVGETLIIEMNDVTLGDGEAIWGDATDACNICIMKV